MSFVSDPEMRGMMAFLPFTNRALICPLQCYTNVHYVQVFCIACNCFIGKRNSYM